MPADMKAIIADTFTELIQQGDVDKITVKNVIEKCHISRQTFYYHFHDLMDVLEWSLEQSTRKLVEESLDAKDLTEALRKFVEFTVEHQKGLKRMLESREQGRILEMLIDAVASYLKDLVAYREPELKISYAELETGLYFYACGLVGTLLRYARKPRVNQEQLIRQLENLLTTRMLAGENKEAV